MAIALGNFDGIHRGHQQVIQPIIERSDDLYKSVVTFSPHPQEVLTGSKRLLLTPPEEKAAYLARMGMTQLTMVPFDRAVARLSPEDFVRQILVQSLQVKVVSVGADFRFGYRRSGNATDLKAIAARFGIEAIANPLLQCEDGRISSSEIRSALENGEVARARRLLGRPYQLQGKVVRGQQLGRTLGFPTANLQLPSGKFLPRFGVYGVRAYSSPWGNDRSIPGVTNIGRRPTANGTEPTVEVHLFDWSGNLYDRHLSIELETFLRPEQKFPSLDALKAQIQTDCTAAKAKLNIS